MIIWPAVIFAASRTHSVIGRIKILAVSIITIEGFNQPGAPPGRRFAAAVVGLVIAPEIISPNHMGSPNLNVNKRWEENLKI